MNDINHVVSNASAVTDAFEPYIGKTPGVGPASDLLGLINAANEKGAEGVKNEAFKMAVEKGTTAFVTAVCAPEIGPLAVPVGVAAGKCAGAAQEYLVEHPELAPDGTSFSCAKTGDCSAGVPAKPSSAEASPDASSLGGSDAAADDAAAATAANAALSSAMTDDSASGRASNQQTPNPGSSPPFAAAMQGWSGQNQAPPPPPQAPAASAQTWFNSGASGVRPPAPPNHHVPTGPSCVATAEHGCQSK